MSEILTCLHVRVTAQAQTEPGGGIWKRSVWAKQLEHGGKMLTSQVFLGGIKIGGEDLQVQDVRGHTVMKVEINFAPLRVSWLPDHQLELETGSGL